MHWNPIEESWEAPRFIARKTHYTQTANRKQTALTLLGNIEHSQSQIGKMFSVFSWKVCSTQRQEEHSPQGHKVAGKYQTSRNELHSMTQSWSFTNSDLKEGRTALRGVVANWNILFFPSGFFMSVLTGLRDNCSHSSPCSWSPAKLPLYPAEWGRN